MPILDEAQILASKIVSSCQPEKVILFGSVARGGENGDADIDLLVIRQSGKKRPFRIKEIFEALRGIERNFPLDVIVYTPEEIEKRLSLGDYFIKRILKEGRILYG